MRWLAGVLIAVFSAPVAAQKLTAKLECRYAGTDFVYDCRIGLERGGQPLSGAELTVGADMPSMPMAHNIKPVKAKPTGKPGEYRARLELEMTGEWAVKLRIAGPVRDQLVLHYVFTESGTAPRK
jgi:hypothetical protein